MIPLAVFLASLGILYVALVETAFGVLMRLSWRLEAERDRDDALRGYLEDPLTLFVPLRLMHGLLLVCLVVLLAEGIGTGLREDVAVFAFSAMIALGVGQVLPALIVRDSPDRVLDVMLSWFTVAANVLSPITGMIVGWMHPVNAPNGRHGDPAGNSESAAPAPPVVGGSSADTRQSAAADERGLLRSVVDFGETLVREVMTPRPDIVAIAADATIADLRRLVQEQEYSRLPVYTTNLDNIVGLIVVKDVIQMAELPPDTGKVSEIMRPAAFVPETKRVMDLLREFQRRRFQLAIVVDEYGGTAGLVTVEDVVEELVGEIRDEYDSDAEPIVQESPDSFVFSAKVGIADMIERLGVDVDDGDFETVGGYVLARVGRVPAVGERFDFDGLEVEVLEAERRRIHKVRVRRTRVPLPDAEA